MSRERAQRDHSAIQSMSRSLADCRHTRKIIESLCVCVFDVSHIELSFVDLRSESPWFNSESKIPNCGRVISQKCSQKRDMLVIRWRLQLLTLHELKLGTKNEHIMGGL